MFEVDGIRYAPVSSSERTCDAIDCVFDESAANTKIASTVSYNGITLSVKTIQPYLAYNNKYIKSLVVDVDGELPNYAFTDCSNMQNATLGQKVSAIGSYAFQGCSSLEALEIPGIVTAIYNYAFDNCTSLKKVTIDDSENTLTFGSNDSNPIFSSCPLDYVYIGRDISYSTSSSISENEFYGCTNLQIIAIGDGVTTIGNRAFSGCSSLQYFAFGTQVADIGEEAFSDCAAMVEIVSKTQNPPVCGSHALDDINKIGCKLYVPDGCMTVYENADQWKDFFFMDEGEGTASQGESGEQIVNKCETPTITLVDNKLSFASETEGVVFHYTISVYASKDGYSDSEVARANIVVSGIGLFGDLDGNGTVNVADHVKLTKIIMNQE